MICKKCKCEIPDESKFCLNCGARLFTPARKPKTRGNGTGTAYRRGKTWTAKVVCGTKIDFKTGDSVADIRTKGGFPTKTAALNHCAVLKAAPSPEAIKPTTTLATLWRHYSEGAMLKISKGKQSHYRAAYKKIAALAHRTIGGITINDLQDIVDDQAPTFYPARDIKVLLSHLYDRAVAQGDVHANIARYIELPELEEGERKPFHEADLKKIWQDYAAGNAMSGYILLMVYSGMMPGELRRCKKDMIIWERQQIIGCGLKTKKRKETPIVVADLVVPVLLDLCAASPSDKLYHMEWYDHFYQDFHAALARCGIEDRPPYACRHTTATALALGNIAPETIKEIMRHSKFSTTERYIHKEYDAAPSLEALNSIVNK